MLVQLTIRDFAIIESLAVSFSTGLNILSGETGAGKSILINAVNLILGGRASIDLIRTGADKATVEALFQLPEESNLTGYFSDMDIPFDGDVLIKRVITKKGKSRIWINGTLATLQMISTLGPNLISISGQNEHQLLIRPDNHLFILDEFGGLSDERIALSKLYWDYHNHEEKLKQLRNDLKNEEEKKELIEFQVKEIEDSRLVQGEDGDLEAERKRLIHAERLINIVFKAYQTLYEKEGSILSELSFIAKDMDRGVDIDPNLDNFKKQLESSQLKLEDVALGLRDFYSKLRIDPGRLEEVEDRLQLIRRLKKKYGPSIEEILAFKEQLLKKRDQMTIEKEELKELESGLEKKRRALLEAAKRLSQKRHEIASRFEKRVESELGLLGMAGTEFKIKFNEITSGTDKNAEKDMHDMNLTADGIDILEFMISPNIGEELRPLAKIASGGELSRIMLSLKTILARSGLVETIIFDEIDSGIGGATAAIVGEKLKSLARFHQILCITHLPQIASCGENHFLVEKRVRKGRTKTFISSLDRNDREREIARLLGGKTISEKSLAHAREMLSS